MLSVRGNRGFSLIELMITISIAGLLIAAALPSFTTSLQNGQVRTTAQTLVTSLQLARAEAVRRNGYVQMTLLNTLGGASTTGGSDFTVLADDQSIAGTPSYMAKVSERSGMEGGKNVRLGTRTAIDFTSAAAAGTGMPATITFNGLGRLDSTTTVRQIDVSNAVSTTARRLSITIAPGGQIKLCDPALVLSVNPQGCA